MNEWCLLALTLQHWKTVHALLEYYNAIGIQNYNAIGISMQLGVGRFMMVRWKKNTLFIPTKVN